VEAHACRSVDLGKFKQIDALKFILISNYQIELQIKLSTFKKYLPIEKIMTEIK
jgi:hypothetical protein